MVRPRVYIEIGISRNCIKPQKEGTSAQKVRSRVYREKKESPKTCNKSRKEGISEQEANKGPDPNELIKIISKVPKKHINQLRRLNLAKKAQEKRKQSSRSAKSPPASCLACLCLS